MPSTPSPALATRTITILVAAMGGEGGGVLADWLIAAATAEGFPVQSTSVPGVAQRTGATNYYLEIHPFARGPRDGAMPIFSLTPNPGDVDLVAASELVEAGRVLQGGFVHPERTTLVASTHREYAVSEKSAMGDGRYDGQRVIDAARRLAHRTALFDMRALAWKHGTVINTVMFGAMAGSGALPFSRAVCEAVIRASGKSVDASLKGFAAGFDHVAGGAGDVSVDGAVDGVVDGVVDGDSAATPAAGRTDASAAQVAPGAARKAIPGTATSGRQPPASRVQALPAALQPIVSAGVAQLADYQGLAYVSLYLDRVEAVVAGERDPAGGYRATLETARYLALWMSYEDVIRVADLKTRQDRLQRVRREVGARDGEPLRLTEYLKPGLDELCSLLPMRPATWLRRRYADKAHRMNVGLHMRTDTVAGFLMLCVLRSLRPLRPRTSRYAIEQAMIERWLAVVCAALPRSPDLALQLALCGNLVKGYGETSERGHKNLQSIIDDVAPSIATASPDDLATLATRVQASRNAALADPEGRTLATALGLPPPEIKSQPIRIVRRPTA